MKKNPALLTAIAIVLILPISIFASAQPMITSAESLSSSTQSAMPSVITDKQDYFPGETVLITGSGFQAGESVKLQVLHDSVIGDNETSGAHAPWYITADEN